MKQLLRFLKNYRKETILAPLFKMLEASFELFVPLVVAAMIDQGITQKDSSFIIRMGLLLLLLAGIGLACSITAQFFAARAAVGFAARLKSALFAHIQSLSYTEMDTMGTSTLITRMTSDVNQLQNGVNLTLRLFLRSPFIVFGAIVMAFTIDVQAALVFVVAIPLLAAVVFGIMLATMPLYKKVQSRLDTVLGITRENLTGARVIRAFAREEDEIARFEEKNELLTKMQKFVGRISALMNPVTFIIVNAAIIALIWTGAWKVDSGALTQGQVVALVNYMNQILVELVKMANLIISMTKAFACANRIQSVFEVKSSMVFPEADQKTADKTSLAGSLVEEKNLNGNSTDTMQHGMGLDSEYMVEFDHASLRYQTAGDRSLTDLDFRVKRGQTIGIIGGTGSGKSSLVNLIARFYDVEEGRVCIDGRDVREYPRQELRDRVGIVPQKAVLFAGTIAENLRWGCQEATEEQLKEALQIAQASEFVEQKEGGLDFYVEQGGKNLSGGQRQRLTIARAVVKQPEILILDDSASALDFATDARLRQSIRNMKSRPTVFIVSQRTSSIQYADQIVVLDDGTVVGIGTHEELLKSCPVYQEIYQSQYRKEEA